MSVDAAIRLTEILLACALIQQSLEHLRARRYEALLFAGRIALCLLLAFGVAPAWTSLALVGLSLLVLQRFDGPYNGGSDRMGLLALCCLCATHFMPNERWREIVLGYLAVQLVLSYFLSGWVKVVNPDWRSGRALREVFQFSAYPVSEDLRRLAERPRLLRVASWAVIGFELAFPLALVSQTALILALATAALFHLANACLFGLNRFFWTWLAVYPAILWLQHRLF
jgi:Vitamin K-dependent gamma-carboxylase